MRVLDPETHPRESISDFLRANGVDPNRVPLQPFVYDGRKREIRVDRIAEVDGIIQLTPDKSELLTVPSRYRVVRGHEPSKYLGK
ncbi:hypothetical protein [Pseudarthrobacter siccitolerans]